MFSVNFISYEVQEGNIATQTSLNDLITISLIHFHSKIKEESIPSKEQNPQKE